MLLLTIAIKEVWEISIPGHYPIIISTDEVLSDLNITDVDWLIHYSVSLHVQTKFNFRFSTLMNNLQKVVKRIINFFFTIHFILNSINH